MTTNELVVRPLGHDDVAAAVALLLAGTLSPDAEDVTRLDRYWSAVLDTRRAGGDVFVADRDGDVVGVCQLLVFRHFQHTGGLCAELESVHVRDDSRSQGVGRELVAFAEQFARDAGCYRLQLTSNLVRTHAHRFYEANGFRASHRGFKKDLRELP